MLFDELLQRHVGSFGRYQLLVVLLVTYEEVYFAMQAMCAVFLAATPDHWCLHPDSSALPANCTEAGMLGLTVPWEHNSDTGELEPSSCSMVTHNLTTLSVAMVTELCGVEGRSNVSQVVMAKWPTHWNESERCESWGYDDSQYTSTIVTEFGAVCDHRWMASTVSSTFLAGWIFGNIAFGWLADRYGRRIVILVPGILNVACGVAAALSNNYWVFLVLRTLQSFFGTGKSTHGFVIAMEYSGPEWRVPVGSYYMITWAIGYILVAPLAYLFRDWRHLLLIITVPELTYYVLVFFLLPESPRWLYMTNRAPEADVTMRKMAAINKRTLPEPLEVTDQVGTSKCTPLDLIRTRQMLIVTAIQFFIWGANGFVYYGLSLSTGSLAGNPYINYVISGLIEIPAYILIIITFKWFGRIWPFAMMHFIGGVAILVILPIPTTLGWLSTTLAMVGKFCITASFAMCWIYATEVYPTCVRSIGLCYVGVAARIVSPIAPFVSLLEDISHALPSIIFGSLALAGGVLVFFLPETKDMPLTQSIEEGEEFIRNNRICGRKKSDDAADEEEDAFKVPPMDFNGVINPAYSSPEATHL